MKPPRRNEPMKRLLSLAEVVKEFGGTLWFWRTQIWSGRIPVVQVGRKQWIDVRDLENFIDSHKKRIR